MYTNENSFGPPYYLGGFLTGSVVGICIISKKIVHTRPV